MPCFISLSFILAVGYVVFCDLSPLTTVVAIRSRMVPITYVGSVYLSIRHGQYVVSQFNLHPVGIDV